MMAHETTKSGRPWPADHKPRKDVPVRGGATQEETDRNLAALVTSPELAAYRVINGAEGTKSVGEWIDVPNLMANLREQAAAVNNGNMTHVESMLMNQATALQTLFARLAERGMGCTDVVPFETNMRIALRAQSQCRATLETLAAIKHPPVVFARQANIAHGPQQVNNGVVAEPPRARENEIQPSQLSGGANELLPDTRASGATLPTNPALEAVGSLDRAQVARG